MKIDLLLQQIQDVIVRENFRRIKKLLESTEFGNGTQGPPGPPGPSGPAGAPGAPALFEAVPVTITAVNTWTNVPLTSISQVSDIEVFDQSNMEKLIIDARLVGINTVQIRSKKLYTYTVHVEGI